MSKNVLIVEDEVLVALDMEEVISQAGFTVVGLARDPDEAMRLIDREHIDVAIVDANLCGQSCAPIALRLRARGVPFVAISGYSADQLGEWLGDALLLNKPLDSDRLVAEIRRLNVPA